MFDPVAVKVSGLQVFPNMRQPRVLAFGIGEGSEAIREIMKTLRAQLRQFGFKTEKRKFKPHLTVARVKYMENHDPLIALLEQFQPVTLESETLSSISLFKSSLTPQGPVYSLLHKAEFDRHDT